MNVTFYIIKPEAVKYNGEIHKIIILSGLIIIQSNIILLPKKIIEELYFTCSKNIIEATKYFMCNEVSEIGIVLGDNALEELRAICGTETSPDKCKVGTIRNLFGIKEPQYFNGIEYYKNAIHRPETVQEIENNIALIRGLL
jgi:nucleoside diphosphate kinase